MPEDRFACGLPLPSVTPTALRRKSLADWWNTTPPPSRSAESDALVAQLNGIIARVSWQMAQRREEALRGLVEAGIDLADLELTPMEFETEQDPEVWTMKVSQTIRLRRPEEPRG